MMNIEEDFKELWKKYPRKLGYRGALKHYKTSIKEGATKEQLSKAIDNYVAMIRNQDTPDQFVKHGSTFFYNWRDYEHLYEPNDPDNRGSATYQPGKYLQ